ncbi:Ras-like protein family member 10B [Halotydeus destructor]|nr:Ras-like protein family member 10B [Halotydeus destructor]
MPLVVKLVVLGAPGVGKTSLIEHFLDDDHTLLDTARNNVYSVTVVSNDVIYQFKLIDMPAISYFPTNALQEWTDHKGLTVRSAHGYLLVFDLSSPATFQYLKMIREQLFESRNMQNVPIFVVGNKADLCKGALGLLKGHQHHGHHHRHHHHHHHHHHSHHHSHNHDHDLVPAFKDLAQMIRKQWKSFYCECSAKYNWRVVPVFKDLFRAIEASQLKQLSDQQAATGGHHPNRKEEHRESLKSWTLNTTQRSSEPTVSKKGTTSNKSTTNSRRRGSQSCHLM